SAPDPQTWLGHVVRFRASFTGAPSNLIVTLLQDGSPIMGAPFPITGTFTTYELPLDSTAANLITNYSDLQIQFEIDSNGVTSVSWAEFEIPDGIALPLPVSDSLNNWADAHQI